MDMAFTVTVSGDLDDVIERTTTALKNEGFGVLTRIDVHTTLKEKMDVEFRPYVILGACNPALAHQALNANTDVGLLMPCNVTVEGAGAGFNVRFVNPDALLSTGGLMDNEVICEVATDAREGLKRAAQALFDDVSK